MDYKDKLINTLEESNKELVRLNDKQIDVNMKFAEVTKNNNTEYQKTFRWVVTVAIAALVILCLGAIYISTSHYNNDTGKNLNQNINKNLNK